MKFKVSEIIESHEKRIRIKRLQNKITAIDGKIKLFEKIKKKSMHSAYLKAQKKTLLVLLAKERMFGK